MKLFSLFFLFMLMFGMVQAQDTTLKEYIGKYSFPDGTPVTLANVTLKDTVLTISSAQGSSDLMKRSRDTFALLSYDGTAYFIRNASGNISGIKVEVEDTVMNGTKDGATETEQQKQPADTRNKRQKN